MSPSKASASPAKSGFNDINNPFLPVSPTKMASVSPVKDVDRRLRTDEEDEKLDTRSLLERMKETVEGMKRRRSTINLPAPSPPEFSLGTNIFDNNTQMEQSEPVDDADKENDETAMDIDANHEPSIFLLSRQNPRTQEEKLHRPTSTNTIPTPAQGIVDAHSRQEQDERSQFATVRIAIVHDIPV